MRIRNWAAALVAVGLAACSTGEAAEEPRLATTELSRGDLRITVEATGTVEPIREVEVKSKASGEILRLHVDIGDQVEPGTLLAEVDPRDVRNAFEQAEADLAVAEARSEINAQQLQRQQELLAAGVVTQQETEAASLEAANAEANLVKARTNYDLAELRLRDVTIQAPLRGTILQRNVEEGTVIQSASQNVSGGTVLFVMAALESMQVRDETDMGQLRAGMPANVQVEAYPERTFRGVVEKIEPQAMVQQNVTMFPVIVTLDNRGGLLRPGMNAEVEILVDQALDVLLVPNGALVGVRDVAPAAMALGLDPESLDMGQFGRRPGPTGGPPSGGAGAPGARPGNAGAATGAPGSGATDGGAEAPSEAREEMARLRARVESGEITRDSMRALVRARMASGGAGGAPMASAEESGGGVEARPSVVFVMNAQGLPEPRVIQVGLSDWDNTQVVSGLEGDEVLAVVGAAQLQAQQQEWLERIRSRSGGSPFGGGRR
ncbi:MAG: efflux RND transporter periplasmic adaptor subunit [Gemmatimonadota bacterium]